MLGRAGWGEGRARWGGRAWFPPPGFFLFFLLVVGYGVWVQVAIIAPIFQMNKKEALKGVIVLFFKSNFYRFTITQATPIYHLKFRENPEMAG